ncbi:MAG: molybdenum cofactor guanylyltransferase [Fluviicola sp.]|nr:molybdenum cofactor guanylyltransferase [Fluviicola sp.]
MNKITGVILAGGLSSRMGTDKGLMLLNGKAMIQYLIDTLKPILAEVIIIANNKEYDKFGLKVFPDKIPFKGPVGGIYSGLHHSKTEKVLIVSCDTPFITKELIQLLIDSENNEVVISKQDDKLQPLIGLYSKNTMSTFKRCIEEDKLKLRKVLAVLQTKIINLDESDIDSSVFYNINTLSEFNKAKNEDRS